MGKFTVLSLALVFILTVGCSDNPTAVSTPDDSLSAVTALEAASFNLASTDGMKQCSYLTESGEVVEFSIPEDRDCPSFEDAEEESILEVVEVEGTDGKKTCYIVTGSLKKLPSFSIPEDQECPRVRDGRL